MYKVISDRSFIPTWSINKFFCSVKDAGFDGIEFNVYEDTGVLNLQTSLSEAKNLAKNTNEIGLRVASLSTILLNNYPLTSSNVAFRKRSEEIILRMLELAETMGVTIIQIVPGVVTSDIPYDYAYERAQESIARIAPQAYEANVTIGVENVCNKFLLSPVEFARFLDEINHHAVKAYIDIGNALVTGYPEHWIRLMGHRLVDLHIKDCKMTLGNSYSFVPALAGDVNWQAVTQALRDIGYDGYVTSTPTPFTYCLERLVTTSAQDLRAILEL